MPNIQRAAKKGAAKKGSSKKAGARAAATSGAVPPYGPPIREAIARGDAAEMRKVAASARKWIKDAQAALDKLEQKLAKSGGK
ncbi:MAG TPA: DUF1843 domain-containing protein [Pyrinomonadaceae bacterium]